MEKKTKEIDTFKYTKVKKNVSVFIARDGSEHKTEKQCLTYEKQLDYQDRFNQIKKVEIKDDSLFADTWFYANNEEELEMIKDYFYYADKYDDVFINGISKLSKKANELKVGDWIAMEHENGGEGMGQRYFYTLSYIMDCISDFQNKFMFA